MLDPAFPASARKTLLQHPGRGEWSAGQVSNFLATLVDNNRIGALATIARGLPREREEALGIVPAEITTATPLDRRTAGPRQERH